MPCARRRPVPRRGAGGRRVRRPTRDSARGSGPRAPRRWPRRERDRSRSSSRCHQPSPPSWRPPLPHEQRPALVVPPAAPDLEVAARQPFAPEPRPADQSQGGAVAGLDIRFHPVQAQPAERELERQLERGRHVALPRERRADLIAEIARSEHAADDLVDVDAPDDDVVRRPTDQESRTLGPAALRQVAGELCRCDRRVCEAAMQVPAPAVQPEELLAVARSGRPEVDGRISGSGARHAPDRRWKRTSDVRVITGSSRWFSTRVATLTVPMAGRLRDSVLSTNVVSADSTSPGRTGWTHRRSSKPTAPLVAFRTAKWSAIIRMSIAPVCQPLAI